MWRVLWRGSGGGVVLGGGRRRGSRVRLIPCRAVNDSNHWEALGYDAILGIPVTIVVTTEMRVMGDDIKLLDDDMIINIVC